MPALPEPGLSEGGIHLEERRDSEITHFGQVDVFVEGRTNASELRVRKEALEIPSITNRILLGFSGIITMRNFSAVTENHEFWLH